MIAERTLMIAVGILGVLAAVVTIAQVIVNRKSADRGVERWP